MSILQIIITNVQITDVYYIYNGHSNNEGEREWTKYRLPIFSYSANYQKIGGALVKNIENNQLPTSHKNREATKTTISLYCYYLLRVHKNLHIVLTNKFVCQMTGKLQYCMTKRSFIYLCYSLGSTKIVTSELGVLWNEPIFKIKCKYNLEIAWKI